MIWAFVGGKAEISEGKVKKAAAVVILIAMIGAVIWATGFYTTLFEFFTNNVNSTIWINALFIIVIAVALALVLGKKNGGSS